jgi:hypothetical protein
MTFDVVASKDERIEAAVTDPELPSTDGLTVKAASAGSRKLHTRDDRHSMPTIAAAPARVHCERECIPIFQS